MPGTSFADTMGATLGLSTPSQLGYSPLPGRVGVPRIAVTIAGIDYSNTVLGVSISYGLDIGIASATIDFVSNQVDIGGGPNPATDYPIELLGVNYYDTVVIRCGSDPTSPNWTALRFTGLFLRVEATMWPGVFQIVCKGNLYRAAQFYPSTMFVGIPADEFQGAPLGLLLTQNQINGVDHLGYVNGTACSVDTSDKNIVKSILELVPNLIIDPANIKGTGDDSPWSQAYICGSDFDAVWPPYRSAWDQIQLFDQAFLGYRTYEGFGGTIYRSLIFGYPQGIADTSFTEGIDVWEAHTSRTVEPLINASYVEGMTNAAGASLGAQVAFAYVPSSNPFQGDAPQNPGDPGVPVVETFRSPFIETNTLLDPTHASPLLHAEDVADWRLSERNRELVNVTLTTYRDDLLGIGRTITVNIPHAAISQPVWIQRVEVRVQNQPALFQQTIYGLGGGLPGYGPSISYSPPPVA